MVLFKKVLTIGMVGLFIALNGCGVMMTSGKQSISITSDPQEVQVTVKPTGEKITTPGTIHLKTKESYTLIAEKPGYKNASITIERRINTTAVILDSILCLFYLVPGAIAFAIDAGTGGLWELEKTQVYFEMVPETEKAPPKQKGQI